jgi:hypothetical protein
VHGRLELLDVFRRELRPVDGKGQLIELSVKSERYLIIPIVHRCTGIGAHVKVFVPLQRHRNCPLHLLRRYNLAVNLEYDFKYDGLGAATLAFGSPSGLGRSGTGVLKVDGKVVATQKMEKTIPMTLQWDENFDVGADTGTPVDDRDYHVPFKFNGKLDKLTLTIDRPKLSPADIEKLKKMMHANSASE